MTYTVIASRNIGNAPDFVVATTKRYNGAVSERDRYVESVADNQRKHFPGMRVVIGPTVDGGDEIAVITMLSTFNIVEVVSIKGPSKPPMTTCGVRNCRLNDDGHRRAVEHIERKIGPDAARDFEMKHSKERDD